MKRLFIRIRWFFRRAGRRRPFSYDAHREREAAERHREKIISEIDLLRMFR